jgi:hypothetical protein
VVVVIQSGGGDQHAGQRFALVEHAATYNEDIFNKTLEDELGSKAPVTLSVLAQAVQEIERGLKVYVAKSRNQWNATTNRHNGIP